MHSWRFAHIGESVKYEEKFRCLIFLQDEIIGCYAEPVLATVGKSVCLSVCHTLVLSQNGAR